MGAVWITYFIIGLGLMSFLGWLGQDHLVARGASIIALVMALWMLKDVFLPGVGPSMMAPAGTHGRMQKAMEKGGLGGHAARRRPGRHLHGALLGRHLPRDRGGAARLGRRRSPAWPSWPSTTSPSSCPSWLLLLMVSDKRVLGRMGRWNRANSPWVKAGLALAVIAMSLGLMVTM